MRSVIISCLLCACCLVGAFTAGATIEHHVTGLCGTLNTMENVIHDNDWPSAQKDFDTLRSAWHDQAHFWRLLLDHQQITDIEANLLRVGAYIYAEDDAQSLAELASLYATYQHIMLLEKLTWDNIL